MRKLIILMAWLGSLLGMLTGARAADASRFRNVKPDEFEKLAAEAQVVVLDVRTPGEFKRGYIKGAVLADFMAADFDQKTASLDKNKTYLVYCAGGVRSVKACKKLGEQGFAKLVNLDGGFMAWQSAGKKVEK